MLSLFGVSPETTAQERVTRLALGFCLLFMVLVPLPFCVWNLMGLAAYAVYLLPLWYGLYPLKSKELSEAKTFHWLFGAMLIVVALSINTSVFCLPVFFILLTLYLTYWQLEKRLFAIRKALNEYDFAEIKTDDYRDMVSKLVKSSLLKSILPAILATMACAAGLLPYGSGVLVLVLVSIVIFLLMRKKLEIFTKR